MRLIIAAATLVYGLVLALYPRPFRTLFAAEMQDTFRLLLIDAAKHGPLPFLRLFIRETLGALSGTLAEHLRNVFLIAAHMLRLRGKPSRRQYYLWSSVSAVVLSVAPFTPWVISTFPTEPPGSLVYLIFTFWQDTLEHMFVRDILHDTLFSLGVGSIWLYAGGTLLRLASHRHYHAARLCGLAGSTCFMSWLMNWIIITGMTGVGWGYWLCCFALLTSWAIETRWTLRTSSMVSQFRQRLMLVR